MNAPYICIDLKTFYAERGMRCARARPVHDRTSSWPDPHAGRTTICLAISPAMKQPRACATAAVVFEIPQNIDYIMAKPRPVCADYMEMSAQHLRHLPRVRERRGHPRLLDRRVLHRRHTPICHCYGLTAREPRR
ncbi:MAG: hypothetical protein ACLTSX_01970 [Collinsella sp.]